MTYRGLWTHAGVLHAVEDDKLWSIDSAHVKTLIGTLNSSAGPVDFESNLAQLGVNDTSYLYVYTPNLSLFAASPGYPGGSRIAFLDQRVFFPKLSTQEFGWTSIGDMNSIAASDFYSAESSPDLLVSLIAANRELLMLGEESGELWDSVGGTEIVRRSSAAIDYGTSAPHTLRKTPRSVFWLGKEKEGHAQVLMLQGHQVQPISSRYEEEKFDGKDLASATAFTYTRGKQSYYCLNVPGIDTTLVWDETYSSWHERDDWTGGVRSQWRPTCHAFAYGRHYFGCGDKLAIGDPTVNNYLGNPKRRQRIAPVIVKPEGGLVDYSKGLEIVCEKGTGAEVLLRFSDDDGRNWSNWTRATVGEVGRFAKRARFHRLGKAYDRVFEVVMADDAPFNPQMVRVGLK